MAHCRLPSPAPGTAPRRSLPRAGPPRNPIPSSEVLELQVPEAAARTLALEPELDGKTACPGRAELVLAIEPGRHVSPGVEPAPDRVPLALPQGVGRFLVVLIRKNEQLKLVGL